MGIKSWIFKKGYLTIETIYAQFFLQHLTAWAWIFYYVANKYQLNVYYMDKNRFGELFILSTEKGGIQIDLERIFQQFMIST